MSTSDGHRCPHNQTLTEVTPRTYIASIPSVAALRVSSFIWNSRPVCGRTGVQFALEWLSSFSGIGRQSGISDADLATERPSERFCNAVAAEFLVPEDLFRPRWQLDIPWENNLAPLAECFHVSRWVIARRARTYDLISKPDYDGYVERQLVSHRLPRSEEPNAASGPSFYRLLPARVSKRLSQAVAIESLSGRLSLREAHQLIGVNPHRMAEFAHKELGL